MTVNAAKPKHTASCLLAVVALVGFVASGCSEIRPEPNVEEGGLLESPTHEADSLRRTEERQQQNRGGGGGAVATSARGAPDVDAANSEVTTSDSA
jgi:hypothetical protein